MECFYKAPCDVLACRWLVDKDGQRLQFTGMDKVVYVVMRNRFEFFHSNGKEYYDSLDAVADMSGTTRRTVSDILGKLIACGVVSGTLSRNAAGNKKWYFTNVEALKCKEDVAYIPDRLLVGVDYSKAPSVHPFLPTGVVNPVMSVWIDETGADIQELVAYRKINPIQMNLE